MNTAVIVGPCPHGSVLTIAGPISTRIEQMNLVFPCGCGMQGSLMLQAAPPKQTAPSQSIFQKAVTRVDFTAK